MLMGFSERPRLCRLRACMTQKDVAEALGLHISTISKYEKEGVSPSIEIAAKLAGLYRVSLDYLVGLERSDNMTLNGLSSSDQELVLKIIRRLGAED